MEKSLKKYRKIEQKPKHKTEADKLWDAHQALMTYQFNKTEQA